MRTLVVSKSFKRDLKRVTKRGWDLDRLEQIVDDLRDGLVLDAARLDHPLKGTWKHWRECHVLPDWLLIYQLTDDELRLARTGSHADLFAK
jgi:mRNA interferase YafQ